MHSADSHKFLYSIFMLMLIIESFPVKAQQLAQGGQAMAMNEPVGFAADLVAPAASIFPAQMLNKPRFCFFDSSCYPLKQPALSAEIADLLMPRIKPLFVPKGSEVKLAKLIQEIMTTSAFSAEYIQFVLDCPSFSIALLPASVDGSEPVKFGGKYIGAKNIIGMVYEHLSSPSIKASIKHEFWHAFQTILRDSKHDPKEKRRLSCQETEKKQAPFSTLSEKQQLKQAIMAGKKRIIDCARLMQTKKQELSKAEIEKIKQYAQAAKNYMPRERTFLVRLSPGEKATVIMQKIKQRKEIVYLGTSDKPYIFEDIHTVNETPKGLEVYGGFSKANTSLEKLFGFVQDFQYIFDFVTKEYQQGQQACMDAENLFLMETDPEIAALLDMDMLETFFPEWLQYHQEMFEKYVKVDEKPSFQPS
ncbi:MAG: hypothetical protein K0S08_2057 [Gammaproteobacteria bacterium]|nr:hypothetical protein [Gammaproteobacteria bacterium]